MWLAVFTLEYIVACKISLHFDDFNISALLLLSKYYIRCDISYVAWQPWNTDA